MRQDFRVEPKVHIPVLEAPIKVVPAAPVVQEPVPAAPPEAPLLAKDVIPNALVELPKKLKEPKPRPVRVPDAAGCEPQYASETVVAQSESTKETP